jgi:hypothetical protein
VEHAKSSRKKKLDALNEDPKTKPTCAQNRPTWNGLDLKVFKMDWI